MIISCLLQPGIYDIKSNSQKERHGRSTDPNTVKFGPRMGLRKKRRVGVGFSGLLL